MTMRIFISIIILSTFLIGKSQAQEKIHLHIDKDIYLPGESIWFKAYLFNNNQPSFLSTNFYLAVYDDEGKLLQQKHYPIFNGTCNGDVALPDTLTTNNLRLRVFTRGLLLSDSNNFYERVVTVFQKGEKGNFSQTQAKPIQIEFIPEGGTAIAGLQNYFSIKASYGGRMSAQINGAIIEDNTGNFIDSFYTSQTGLGKIQIIPEAGKTYSAIWLDKQNNKHTASIISQTTNGALFHFEKVKNVLYCNVLKNSDEIAYNTLAISASSGSEEIMQIKTFMNNKVQWIHKIPIDSLPEGIIHFKLYDSQNKLLQQRVILNSTLSDTKEPFLKIVKKNLDSKGETIIELEIPDSLFNNMSVSVSDINFYETGKRNNIKEDLWLTKDILPENQFTKENIQNNTKPDIDLVLLTARFGKLKDEFKNPKSLLDNFLSVQATYKNKNYALPKESNLMLIIKDTILGKRFYKVAASGQVDFKKDGLIFYDSANVNYQLDKNKEEAEYMSLLTYNKYKASPLIAKYQSGVIDTLLSPVNDNSENYLSDFVNRNPKKFNEVQTIKEVVIKSKYKNQETARLQELEKKYTTGMFSGLARGYQLNVLDDKNAWGQSDILNYLVYRVPGLRVISNRGEKYIVDAITKAKILTFVDEVELAEQTGISAISMTQIAYVKYIPGIVIGSSFVSSGGVLYIYTKKGDEAEPDNGLGMRKIKLKGYDIPQDYTSPDYSDKKNLLNADMRTTLYWNPYVIADKENKKIEIKFNNNDVSTKLLLTIEGFNEEGKLIHIEKLIEN
jgi:hypothetical protein